MAGTDQTAPPPAPAAIGDVTSKPLPAVKPAIAPFHEIPANERSKVESLIKGIDMGDSNSIIFFGTKAQQKLTTLSDNMLEGVRNKDVGPAAGSLSEMVTTLRGFDADELAKKPGFFARLFGSAKPVVKFLQQYEGVRKQIDVITDKLEEHKTKLLTDIASLDRLYGANLDYFHELDEYIAAGDEKLRQLDTGAIPDLAQSAKNASDMLQAQQLRDLRSARDDLERRVHDLRLTRQVTMQALPSLRLVQENDKSLVRKIQSTVANTVPLWRQQLAQAVTIYRSGQAATMVKEATDLTNELLEKNADNLKIANREVRQQMERSVFDVEVVKHANQALIETIEESLQIAAEGKRKRAAALGQLQEMETRLREALASTSAKVTAPSKPELANQAEQPA